MSIALAILIGVVAGSRAMLAPAALSWVALRGHLDLSHSWLAVMGYRWTPWIFSVAAAAELVTDQLPSTPSRKVPPQFGARLVMGALSGAMILTPGGQTVIGAVCGIAGAVAGTLAGASLRARLARRFGADRPAALIEDAIAIILAAVVVSLTV